MSLSALPLFPAVIGGRGSHIVSRGICCCFATSKKSTTPQCAHGLSAALSLVCHQTRIQTHAATVGFKEHSSVGAKVVIWTLP